MNNGRDEFQKQFGDLPHPNEDGNYENVLDVPCDFDDTPKPYNISIKVETSSKHSKQRAKKRIHATSDQLGNKDDIGDILEKNILFGSKRKKNAALKHVNKYLSETNVFSFNNVDEIKFDEINSKLVGKCVNRVMYKNCHTMT